MVVVPTENLKDQWTPQLDGWGLGLNSEVQIINTVVKKNWKADILVLDECHRYNSETFKEVFNRVEYKYILGLTATFERLDEKHKIMAQYCPIIDSITTEEALLNGWISKFNEYQVLIDVDDIDVYKQYNKDFIEHFEFFNFDFNLARKYGPYVSNSIKKTLLTAGNYHSLINSIFIINFAKLLLYL